MNVTEFNQKYTVAQIGYQYPVHVVLSNRKHPGALKYAGNFLYVMQGLASDEEYKNYIFHEMEVPKKWIKLAEKWEQIS